MVKYKKIVITLSIIAVIILYVFFISNGNSAVNLKYKKAQIKSVEKVILVSGYFEAVNKTSVMSEVSGRVENIFVKKGLFVNKGEPLLKIDTEELDVALKKSLLDSKLRLLEIKRLSEKLKFYKKIDVIYDKQKNRTITKVQYFQNLQNLKDAEIAVDISNLTLEQNREIIMELKMEISKATILAPFKGYISDIFIQEGGLVTENSIHRQGTRLIMLINNKKMFGKLLINEIDSIKLNVGDKVSIRLASNEDLSFESEIKFIDFKISDSRKKSGSFVMAETDILELDGFIKEGVSFRGDIITSIQEGVSVLEKSIIHEKSKKYLLVKDNNKLKKVNVELGLSDGKYVIITSGINSDAKYLTRPSSLTIKIDKEVLLSDLK